MGGQAAGGSKRSGTHPSPVGRKKKLHSVQGILDTQIHVGQYSFIQF